MFNNPDGIKVILGIESAFLSSRKSGDMAGSDLARMKQKLKKSLTSEI